MTTPTEPGASLILEHLAGIVVVILFLWTVVLLWVSWQLQRLAKELETERQAMRRWRRLHVLAQRQNTPWQ